MIYSIISLPGRGQWKNLENPFFPGDQTSQFSIRLAKAKMIRQQRLEVFLEVHLQHQGTKGQEADTGDQQICRIIVVIVVMNCDPSDKCIYVVGYKST